MLAEPTDSPFDFKTKLSAFLKTIESALNRHVPPATTRPQHLHAAMRYSLEAGGKRLRPVLVLATAELFPGSQDPRPAAVAVECLHTYSLIHDDLPGIDNSDLRRGRPTCHRQFDEATAILAGDALLTHAFSLLASAYGGTPELAVALIRELSQAADSTRLIGGQMEDILAEKDPAAPEDLEFIHRNKTAALLTASLVMGTLVGNAPVESVDTVRSIGLDLGMAFQIVDDILDATATPEDLGKPTGSDAANNKTTYVSLYGLDEAGKMAQRHTDSALAACDKLPGSAPFLRALISSLVSRPN